MHFTATGDDILTDEMALPTAVADVGASSSSFDKNESMGTSNNRKRQSHGFNESKNNIDVDSDRFYDVQSATANMDDTYPEHIQLRRLSETTSLTLSDLERNDLNDTHDDFEEETTIHFDAKHSNGHFPFPIRQLVFWYSSLTPVKRWRLCAWLLAAIALFLLCAFGVISLAFYRLEHGLNPLLFFSNKSDTAGLAGSGNQPGSSLCLSQQCIKTSAALLSMADESIDPCQDFFEYSCQNFDRYHDLPMNVEEYGVLDQLLDRVMLQMRDIFDHPSAPTSSSNTSAPVKQVPQMPDINIHTLYWTCMDESRISRSGATPVQPLVAGLLDKFPYKSFDKPKQQSPKQKNWWDLDDNQDSDSSVDDDSETSGPVSKESLNYPLDYFGKLTNSIGFLHEMDIYPFYQIHQLPYVNEEPRFRIQQSGLGLNNPEMYTKNRLVNEYRDIVWESFHLILATRKSNFESEQYFQLADSVVAFEKELSKIFWTREDSVDPFKTNNPVNLFKLEQDVSSIIWRDQFAGILQKTGFKLNNFTLPGTNRTFSVSNMTIINAQPSYFTSLSDLLRRTHSKTVYYYLLWNMLQKQMPYLSAHFHKPYLKLQFLLGHKTPSIIADRWKYCVQFAANIMPFVAGQEYVARYFNKESLEGAKSILKQVRQSIHERFAELTWMDDSSRVQAYNKESLMKIDIGYPQLTGADLNEIYRGLDVDPLDFFSNAVNVDRFRAQKGFLTKSPSQLNVGWSFAPHQVGVQMYSAEHNRITITAAMLQPPFFNLQTPSAINYGAIGTIMASELAKSYGRSGRLFDANGLPKPWWSSETERRFHNESHCFIDAYSAIQFSSAAVNGRKPDNSGIMVDSRLTLDENIADVSGLSLAYRAWNRERFSSDPSGTQLPGLPWNDDQLFFVSFAQNWCGLTRDQQGNEGTTKKKIWAKSHSPPRIRVNGALSQSEEFAKAFQCAPGTFMNPKGRKCRI